MCPIPQQPTCQHPYTDNGIQTKCNANNYNLLQSLSNIYAYCSHNSIHPTCCDIEDMTRQMYNDFAAANQHLIIIRHLKNSIVFKCKIKITVLAFSFYLISNLQQSFSQHFKFPERKNGNYINRIQSLQHSKNYI